MSREGAARAARRHASRIGQCLAALQLALHALAFSPPAAAAEPDLVHAVQAGETLYGLAEQYTGRSDRWQLLQQHNGIADPHRIEPGTRVRIPAALLAFAPSFATVEYVTGEVRQFAVPEAQAQPVQAGARLPEGTRIEVGSDGYMRLALSDGSVVRVPANSTVRLAGVRRQEALQANETLIQLDAGRVDVSAQPLRGGSGRFEIRTPLAVASVRGTEFGVAIQPDAGVTGEVMHGAVDLKGRARSPGPRGLREQRLQAGEGARVSQAGTVGPVRQLPAAPDLATLPATITDADFVRLPLPVRPGVAAYRVRIARDPAMEQVVRNGVFDAGELRFAGLDDGDYTVGARGVDAEGLSGLESTRAIRVKARPVAPLSQGPAPGERIVGSRVEFNCAQPAGIRRFRLQVASDESFQDLRVDDPELQECRRTAQLPAGRYFWRVASVALTPDGKTDQGPFSAGRRFDVVEPPPVPPPPRFGDADGALQLYWSALPGYGYRVEVARDSAFADVVHAETHSEAFLHLKALPPGTYYVRMQAITPQGDAGVFSVSQAVRIGPVVRDASGSAVHDGDGRPIGRQ
ncbi:FecR domain-containing protein [Variovorax sp. RA8]|uniref:FecR domain-containing protein n=1 Tax=Variovorax sp. (strain JCM 16519 / RA8) TaxID=662548 RepID=UPI0013185AFD|nr:FecR domain-containing protein [Variovorax sp. RA8]VTU22073.1 FecR protein [Variovorax sp. RA8]